MERDTAYIALYSSSCCVYQYRYHVVFRQICQDLVRYQLIKVFEGLGSRIKIRHIGNYCGRSGPLLMVGNMFFFLETGGCVFYYVQLGFSGHFVIWSLVRASEYRLQLISCEETDCCS